MYLIREMQYHASQKGRIHKWLANRAKVKLVRHYSIFVGYNTKIGKGLQPHLGNNVTLGDGVQVGANAVMNKDAAPGSIWAGVPDREIKHD